MIINIFKLMGAMFYRARTKSELAVFIPALNELHVLSDQSVKLLENSDDTDIAHQLSVLFDGLGDMPAPPWGSVYLDKERVLFGLSTLAYREFLVENELAFESQMREPEDQFGLMLLACAYLLENDKYDQARLLLEQHFLPWAFAYLDKLQAYQGSVLFQQIAQETAVWLGGQIEQEALTPVKAKLYLE